MPEAKPGGGYHTRPVAKLSDVQNNGEGLLKASLNGECVTLSPTQTQQEFRAEVLKLERLIHSVATERARRQAMAGKS